MIVGIFVARTRPAPEPRLVRERFGLVICTNRMYNEWTAIHYQTPEQSMTRSSFPQMWECRNPHNRGSPLGEDPKNVLECRGKVGAVNLLESQKSA